MKARRTIIIILAAVTACLLAAALLIQPSAIPDGNVTVVEAVAQTEAMEHEAFIAPPYEPIVFEGVNVAVEKDAECSSYVNPYVAKKAIDGVRDGASYWEGLTDTYPNTLTIDLGESFDIHAIKVGLNPQDIWGKRTQTFAVYASMNGTDYTELVPSTQYTFDPKTGNEVGVEFETTAAQFVMIEFTENSGATGGQAAEVEVYSVG